MSQWPGNRPQAPRSSSSGASGRASHLTLASVSPGWHAFADSLAVALMRSSRGIVWLRGEAGSGKTELLRAHIPHWPFPSVWMDLRRECEVMASLEPAVPSGDEMSSARTLLILDDMSPDDLLYLMKDPLHPASELLLSHPGPVLLASRASGREDAQSLMAHSGRSVEPMDMPPSGIDHRLSILRGKQPAIEREWRVDIDPDALHRAARGVSPEWPETPGGSLRWLMAAAARVALEAEQGDPALRSAEARIDDLNRALLLAQARGGDVDSLERDIRQAEIERAAYSVDWHEKARRGDLRTVRAVDVEWEIAAARGAMFNDGVPDVLCRQSRCCPAPIAEDS